MVGFFPWLVQTANYFRLDTPASRQATINFLLTVSSILTYSVAAVPSDCLSTSVTLEHLVSCLHVYTVQDSFYTAETYAAAQPTAAQAIAWSSAVSSLMNVGNGGYTCADASNTIGTGNALNGVYQIADYQDKVTLASYCMLVESTVNDAGTYTKGWGFVIVPVTQPALSGVHLSAPHPAHDTGTAQQAGALFKRVNARSLLVSGRSRGAYAASTDCIVSYKGTYYKTDPAHDNEQPFFAASVALFNAQMAQDGCPATTCAFVQLHGKASTTCAKDAMLISAGIGHSPASVAWYTDTTPRPAKSLKTSLLASGAFPSWSISLPSDSDCSLTATGNVFGRFLNGVALANVCSTSARTVSATGRFVHIEQDGASRSPDVYAKWATALEAAFGSDESI